MRRLRLAFLGTPDFAVPVLAALIEAGHEIACVYAQPPRPAGRGQKERPSAVQAVAEERGLAVRTPRSLKGEPEQEAFAALGLDAAVTAAYGLILPKRVLDAPRLGCLNVHASLLPRWRGAAPIQRAVMAGDRETGITIMRVDEGLDTGPILIAEAVPITCETTAASLHDTLSRLGADLAVRALADLDAGCLTPIPQPEEGATYAAKLERDEGRIDWAAPALHIERVLRALNPWPGVWFDHEGHRIKVLAAEIARTGTGTTPGTVLDDRLTVACGEGALRLTRVQREGKKAADAAAFLRGYPLPAGTVLG